MASDRYCRRYNRQASAHLGSHTNLHRQETLKDHERPALLRLPVARRSASSAQGGMTSRASTYSPLLACE
jgi:hypothetical protein